jgi:4-hydroxy-2-oxoheptanedioate aldolase
VRTNALKAKLGAGQRVVGALLTINSADLVELFGHLGYDFVFLDGQHGGLSVETARELVRAAELTGMTPLIRVPRNDPAVILEYLEIGAGGIIVPDVASRADAEAAVRAVKYPPEGARGAMFASRAAFYGIPRSAPEYVRRANAETMVVPILESKDVLPVLDDIVQVPGVDLFTIGPADLGLSMGIQGGWGEPPIQAAVDRIHRAIRAAGRPTMIVAHDPEDGRRLAAQGYQALLVITGSLLVSAGRSMLQALRA